VQVSKHPAFQPILDLPLITLKRFHLGST